MTLQAKDHLQREQRSYCWTGWPRPPVSWQPRVIVRLCNSRQEKFWRGHVYLLSPITFLVLSILFLCRKKARHIRSEALLLIKAFCQEHAIAYCETSMLQSYKDILRFLHSVSAPLRDG